MEHRKFAVVGLGTFGSHVARVLYEAKQDVLAVDRIPDAVEAQQAHCSHGVVADAADREALEAAGMQGVDVAVIALGSRIDVSILATMYLKEMGVKRIIAKAVTRDHARILKRMGASELVHPEADMARRLAAQLARPDVIEEIPFLEGYAIAEVRAPRFLWGRDLAQARLRSRYHLAVIAIKRMLNEQEKIIAATPTFTIEKGDRLLLLARPEDVAGLGEQD